MRLLSIMLLLSLFLSCSSRQEGETRKQNDTEMEKKNAIPSDSTSVPQIPSIPRIYGRIRTKEQGRMKDLRNDKNADTFPLLRAVKNEDENMFMPEKINEKA